MREVRLSPQGDFDNAALPAQHISVHPLSAAMGAEISGVHLGSLSDAAFDELREALWRHKMVFLRNQQLTHAEHAAFSARFGDFAVDAYTQGVEGHRNVHPLIKEADTVNKALFGSGWHTDSPFLEEPPSVTILRAVEIPAYGGDTNWASTALAYRMLSPAMQAMLRPLKVHMAAEANVRTHEIAGGKPMAFANDTRRSEALGGHFHPLVRTHPYTGELALYVDEVYASGIEGMTEAESRPILDFLVRHVTQSAFTCRLRWEPGMIAMWDNRAALHIAANDYDGVRREMYRTTMAGEKPE